MTTDNQENSDKPVLGVRESVIVHGQRSSAEIEARVDTGAQRTSLDTSVACSIGAGPLTGETTFRSSTGDREKRVVAELIVEVRGEEHEVDASLTDRSSLSTDLRLGRDILEGYLVDITK